MLELENSSGSQSVWHLPPFKDAANAKYFINRLRVGKVQRVSEENAVMGSCALMKEITLSWLQNIFVAPNVATEKYKCEMTEHTVRIQPRFNNADPNSNWHR